MELKGTVLNVVDFGAFVDIGLKDSGLVHISQLANRYIKSPHDVVSVGDVVTVWVMSVDQERKRVSLTMVKPGTERQRGDLKEVRAGDRPATNHLGKARARVEEIVAAALVPAAPRLRRHRLGLRPSPRSRKPRVAVLTVTVIVNEGVCPQPAATPVRTREAVGLFLPAASRTRLPGQDMGRGRLGEGHEEVRDRSDRAPDQDLGQGGPGRSGPSGRRPHAVRLDLPDQVRPRRPSRKRPSREAFPYAPLVSLNSSGKHEWIRPRTPRPGNPLSRILSCRPTTSLRPRQMQQSRPHRPRKLCRETLARLNFQ